jgi:hypothetical protein
VVHKGQCFVKRSRANAVRIGTKDSQEAAHKVSVLLVVFAEVEQGLVNQ